MIHNKRKHPRAECLIHSTFNDLDATDRSKYLNQTAVTDISEGGIRFRTSRFIPIRNRLLFHLSPEKKMPFEAVVKPAWINEIPHLGQFEIGAAFLSISPEDKKLIQELLANPSPVKGPVFGWLQ